VAEALQSVADTVNTEVLPVINGVIAAIQTRTEYQDQVNRNVISKLENPYGLVAQYEEYGFEDKATFEAYIAEITGKGQETPFEALAEGFRVVEQGLLTGVEETLLIPPPVKAEATTPMSFEMPGISQIALSPGWFQGEY